MNLTLEEYFNLQDALFHLNNQEKKDERIALKKALSKNFKKTFPKGIAAENYKKHKDGKKLLCLEFKATKEDQALIDEAVAILDSGEKIWHAIPKSEEVIVEVI